MSLTREDMLRELELLPAWSLRNPLIGNEVALKQNSLQLTKIGSANTLPLTELTLTTMRPIIDLAG